MRNNAQIRLIGFVGNDPQYKDKAKYPNWLTFQLGVSDSWKDKNGEWQKNTNWYECKTISENGAKAIEKNVQKGTKLLIEGAPKSKAFINKEGVAQGSIEVTIFDFEVMNGGKEKAEGNKEYTVEKTKNLIKTYDILDDEIPF